MNRTLTLTSAAFGLALLLIGAPAYASSEAPVAGSAGALTAPSYSTAGSEGAPVFAAPAASGIVVLGMPGKPMTGEAGIGPRA